MFEPVRSEQPDDEPVSDIDADNVVWLFGVPTKQRLEWLLDEPPSARTLHALELMADTPMSAEEQMLYAALWQRQEAATTARAMAARVAATTPHGTGWTADPDLLAAELALMLRRTDTAMACELTFARRLHAALPQTFRLLTVGDITVFHARAIDTGTRHLTEEQARAVDAAVADRAVSMTASAFRRIVRKAVTAVETTPRERLASAERTAGVQWWPDLDGMGTLAVRTTASNGVALLEEINRRADTLTGSDEHRTHGMRQTDAVLDALLGTEPTATGSDDSTGAPAGQPTRRASRRGARLVATIDLLTLLGMREHPGELDGHGPVPAQQIRDLLTHHDTVLHRLVYEPVTGNVTDYTIRGYHPDEALRRIITARDITCRYPGCTRNAIYCDTEHCQPHEAGGPTSCANCGLMCRRHHNRKTHHGYQYRRPDPATGETEWTSPAGFTYRQHPARYTPDGRDTGDTTRIIADDPPF